jgi:hypothetical protein
MMPCPYCNSDNVRPTEAGFVSDTHYCNKCNKSYERLSRGVKTVGMITVGGLLLGPAGAALGALLSGSDDDGDAGGGGFL